MGGCRCSYRNCSARSSIQSPMHMFHFPVFDKPRCHQWIINAQKLNFLDLKLSQLKNRVICEHHFKDSDFMNVMKQKLKPCAIPTLDGLYCNKKQEKDDNDDDEDIYVINLEDIENDKLTRLEKRAQFSVKYVDFLTSDVTDIPTLLPNPKKSINLKKDSSKGLGMSYKNYLRNISDDTSYDSSLLGNPLKSVYRSKEGTTATSNKGQNSLCGHQTNPTIDVKDSRKYCVSKSHEAKNLVPTSNKVKILSENKVSLPVTLLGGLQTISPKTILKVPDKRKKQHKEVDDSVVMMKNEPYENNTQVFDASLPLLQSNTQAVNEYLHTTAPDMPNIEHNINNQNLQVYQQDGLQPMYHYVVEPNIPVSFESIGSNVNQISPIADTEMMIPTSAATLPDMPDISMPRTNETLSATDTDVLKISDRLKEPMMVSDDTTSIKHGDLLKNSVAQSPKDKKNNFKTLKPKPNSPRSKAPSSPVKGSILKNKLPPEKLAIIEEKRKHNMKLRDIINSCLNKSDEEPSDTKLLPQKSKKLSNDKKISEHLASVPNLPSNEENMISYLETRLQRMEDKLLNKIAENTKKIDDMKKIIKPSSGKKSVFTQTYTNSDKKKDLYNQISQFLTPEANNLIYEELFINKYSQNVLYTGPHTRKRKRAT